MSIRFAAAGSGECAAVAKVFCRTAPGTPANDCDAASLRDTILKPALHHFAQHGLAAARVARRNAEQALFAGERRDYRHWLAICAALDPRMAARLEQRHSG